VHGAALLSVSTWCTCLLMCRRRVAAILQNGVDACCCVSVGAMCAHGMAGVDDFMPMIDALACMVT
jgi:hypothetical protein